MQMAQMWHSFVFYFFFLFFFPFFFRWTSFARGFFVFLSLTLRKVDASIRSTRRDRDGAQEWKWRDICWIFRISRDIPVICNYLNRDITLYSCHTTKSDYYSHRRNQSKTRSAFRTFHAFVSAKRTSSRFFLSCKYLTLLRVWHSAAYNLAICRRISKNQRQFVSRRMKIRNQKMRSSKRERKREREKVGGVGRKRMKYSCIFHTTRAALRWSYRALTPETRWIFRTYVMSITEKRYSFIWYHTL